MKYYFTTPIYYTNGAPHIGHAYTTIVCDAIRRLKRMQGYDDVVLTSGADEHGVNVERSAERLGKTPYDFSTMMADEFRQNFDDLDIAADDFVRTSSERHKRTVQWLFERCRQNGYVYKGSYTGQYCVFDNLYVNEAKPGDPCPDCGRPTETVTEENFFFKLSAFQEKLLALYEQEPLFIQPETRRNEVIRFVQGGLNDLSITRTSIKWGIPVPGEEPHVFYVWFDALTAYLTGAGGPEWRERGLWPADLHLIGKEILRFHAVYWPAFLMAAGLPLPKKIFAHGWLLFEHDKMSKSRGNIVRPRPIADVVGADTLRYFLLREVVFGQDGNFSYDALVQRYNSDLANGLGNLASRTFAMIRQYRDGRVPQSDGDSHIAETATQAVGMALDAYERFDFSKALEAIWNLISTVDKYIVERQPWTLAKSQEPGASENLDATLYSAAEVVRIVTILLAPVIPVSAEKIWSQLGFAQPVQQARVADLHWGRLPAGQILGAGSAVFPRLDAKVVIPQMREGEEKELARQNALLGKAPAAPAADAPAPDAAAAPVSEPAAAAPQMAEGVSPIAPGITIDDFVKVDLRVGLVKAAAAVKGADKLLHLSVDIGEGQPRSIVAGIAKAYSPDQLVGRKVVIVANLAPRKLRGLESNGMIVAASLDGGSPVLAAFLEDVPVGARLK